MKQSQISIRADALTAAARAIVEAEKATHDAKTARLRKAHLEKEAANLLPVAPGFESLYAWPETMGGKSMGIRVEVRHGSKFLSCYNFKPMDLSYALEETRKLLMTDHPELSLFDDDLVIKFSSHPPKDPTAISALPT
jgi:hypothetical protein